MGENKNSKKVPTLPCRMQGDLKLNWTRGAGHARWPLAGGPSGRPAAREGGPSLCQLLPAGRLRPGRGRTCPLAPKAPTEAPGGVYGVQNWALNQNLIARRHKKASEPTFLVIFAIFRLIFGVAALAAVFLERLRPGGPEPR